MKFVADSMLGRLARWLRILGYDVVHDPTCPVKELVETANRDHRVFLTRRRAFPDGVNATALFNLCSEDFPEQLKRVIRQFDLDTETSVFSRCIDCNVPVVPIKRSKASGRVPERTWKEINVFRECPSCHSVYWEGSHRTNTLKKLHRILHEQGDPHGIEGHQG